MKYLLFCFLLVSCSPNPPTPPTVICGEVISKDKSTETNTDIAYNWVTESHTPTISTQEKYFIYVDSYEVPMTRRNFNLIRVGDHALISVTETWAGTHVKFLRKETEEEKAKRESLINPES